ncbi:MAG: small conductance mechanosensitive channel [Myxococcota bacterium]|jgi:small conductance mechanosensitive channel
MALKLTTRALSHRKMDETLTKYLVSALQVVLNVLLVITILGVFGIQTTSFAAVFAAAGVAIGKAIEVLLAAVGKVSNLDNTEDIYAVQTTAT